VTRITTRERKARMLCIRLEVPFRGAVHSPGIYARAVPPTASTVFHLETLHLDGPTDPPIEGDPRKLPEKWQGRLGLNFDEQMKPVELPGALAGALSGGRGSPGDRQR